MSAVIAAPDMLAAAAADVAGIGSSLSEATTAGPEARRVPEARPSDSVTAVTGDRRSRGRWWR